MKVPTTEEQIRLQREFLDQLADRLAAGRLEYGDASLRRAPAALRGEIEEELLDVCGWSFVLWLRVRALDLGGTP